MTMTKHTDHAAEADGRREGHGSGDHSGHGDHLAMFRRRFWWSLLLTIPLVVTSHMVMDWFGYTLDFSRHRHGSDRCSAPCCSCGAGGRSSPAACRRPGTASPG